MKNNNLFKEFKNDLPASIVVFFVAVPLCLGIALASGAPLFSGIIAGIVGGIVVGIASGSSLGVSGPAAGLAGRLRPRSATTSGPRRGGPLWRAGTRHPHTRLSLRQQRRLRPHAGLVAALARAAAQHPDARRHVR